MDVIDGLLTYGHQDTKSGGFEATQSPLLETGPFDTAARVLQPTDRKADVGSLVLTAHLGFADLVSSSSYALRQIHQTFDATDDYLGYGYEAFPSFVAIDFSRQDNRLYAEELRLISSGQDAFKWVTGVFYQHSQDEFRAIDIGPGYPAFAGIDRPGAR